MRFFQLIYSIIPLPPPHPKIYLIQVQAGISDLSRFQRVVKMIAFHPFDTAENALENINAISEHELSEDLRVRR